jgi:hypothetical protein
MTITIDRPSAQEPDVAPVPGAEYQPSGLAAQAPAEGKVALRTRGTRPCRICQAPCTGRMCRPCWLKPENRSRTVTQKRRQEPRQSIAAAVRMLKAASRRAMEEDPGEGLAALLDVMPELRAFTRDAGIAVVANLGSTVTAEELTRATGRQISRQAVEERWLPGRREANAAAKARRNGGAR